MTLFQFRGGGPGEYDHFRNALGLKIGSSIL